MSRTFYNIIKKRLYSAEDPNVPKGMWENIAKEIPVYKSPKRIKSGWLFLGGLFLLSSLGLGGYFLFQTNEASNQLASGKIYNEEISASQNDAIGISALAEETQDEGNVRGDGFGSNELSAQTADIVLVNSKVDLEREDGDTKKANIKSLANPTSNVSDRLGATSEGVLESHQIGTQNDNQNQNTQFPIVDESKVSKNEKFKTQVSEKSDEIDLSPVISKINQKELNSSKEQVTADALTVVDRNLETNVQENERVISDAEKVARSKAAEAGMPAIFPLLIRKATYDQKPLARILATESISMFHDPECYKFSNRNQSNFSLDIYAGPSFAQRPMKSRNENVDGYISAREDSETFQYTFQIGARLNLMLNNGLAIRTGFHFSQVGERFDLTRPGDTRVETIIVEIFDNNGNLIGTETRQQIITGTTIKKIFNRFKSVDIPVLIGYEMPLGKMNIGFSAGPVLNISSWQRGQFLDPALNPKRIDLDDPLNYFPAYKTTLGIGGYLGAYFTYPMSENMSLFAEPHVLHRFQSITFDQYVIDQGHSQVGLNVGIRFKL